MPDGEPNNLQSAKAQCTFFLGRQGARHCLKTVHNRTRCTDVVGAFPCARQNGGNSFL